MSIYSARNTIEKIVAFLDSEEIYTLTIKGSLHYELNQLRQVIDRLIEREKALALNKDLNLALKIEEK